MRLAITGFGPFPGAPINPTSILIDILRTKFPRRGAIHHIFETTYADVDARLAEFDDQASVICFGLHAKIGGFQIETTARNLTRAKRPDAAGVHAEDSKIAPDAPDEIRTELPADAIARAAAQTGAVVSLSTNAGGYLCNYLYFHLLQRRAAGERRVLFVHAPMASELLDICQKLEPKRKFDAHLPLAALVDGANAIIDAATGGSENESGS